MNGRLLAASACLLGFLVNASSATTWIIKADGTGDAATIQGGLDLTSAGDTVLLMPGQYAAPSSVPPANVIEFPDHPVVLRSSDGPWETQIYRYIAQVRAAGSSGTIIEGIAFAGSPSHAIKLDRFATVRACIFGSGNQRDVQADGVITPTPIVEECLFYGGGGIRISGGPFVVRHNLFLATAAPAGGLIHTFTGTVIENNTFSVSVGPGSPTDCVIHIASGQAPVISKNIFTGMTEAPQVIYCASGAVPLTIDCNNFFDNGGAAPITGCALPDGNIFADPRFCLPFDPSGGPKRFETDMSIRVDSPCAPENSPCGELIGAGSVACGECPPNTTLTPGARIRMQFLVHNATTTADNYLYTIQGNVPLLFAREDAPGVFAPVIGGSVNVGAESSEALAVWAEVGPTAASGDTLHAWLTQAPLSNLQQTDTCTTTIYVVGAPVSATGPVTGATLRQNWPNPFNPSTTIAFTIPAGSQPASLTIYDVGGRIVRQLGSYPQGTHTARWDGLSGAGVSVASGIYLCRLEGTDLALTRKMVLLR